MATTIICSDTKVYCNYKKRYLEKWTLVEIKNDNGCRKYKLTYFNDKNETYRTIDLTAPVIRARLGFMRDYRPELLMEQLNKGTLYLNLLRLNGKVENAIDKQVMKWQETDKEYLAARGDFLQQYAISQRMRMDAEHLLYDAMVYV